MIYNTVGMLKLKRRAVYIVSASALKDAKQAQNSYFSLHHVTDWFPTLINAAGGSLEELGIDSLDGVDQWESLRDGSEGQRTELLYNIVADRFGTTPSAAIRFNKLRRKDISVTLISFSNGLFKGW